MLREELPCILHAALKAISADCNLHNPKNSLKCLFLKDLTEVRLLARRLLCLFNRRTFGATPMNSTLLLANAIALAVLVSFHFIPASDSPEPLAQRMPHYLQVQKAPQLAVLSDQGTSTPLAVSNSEQVRPAPTSEHLVF
jgi:hypothetical protein